MAIQIKEYGHEYESHSVMPMKSSECEICHRRHWRSVTESALLCRNLSLYILSRALFNNFCSYQGIEFLGSVLPRPTLSKLVGRISPGDPIFRLPWPLRSPEGANQVSYDCVCFRCTMWPKEEEVSKISSDQSQLTKMVPPRRLGSQSCRRNPWQDLLPSSDPPLLFAGSIFAGALRDAPEP